MLKMRELTEAEEEETTQEELLKRFEKVEIQSAESELRLTESGQVGGSHNQHG